MSLFLFDLGGVLINHDLRTMVRSMAEKTGCSERAIVETFTPERIRAVETSQIEARPFFDRWVRPLAPAWEYEDWILFWMGHYSLNMPGMRLMEELKAKGGRIFFLSNLAEYNRVAAERKFPGFFKHAERCFFSYELRMFKPDLEIYQAVARGLSAPVEDFVFLDDTSMNVDGAIRAGMKSLVFSNDRITEIRKILLVE